MIHKLKDLDHDGVLPKEKKEVVIDLYRADDPSYIEGEEHNQCLSELKSLAISVDVEELALTISRAVQKFDRRPFYEEETRLPRWIAQAIASNTKCFKLVKG